jgi:hypothetical protein
MYTIASAIVALSAGASAVLAVEASRRRASGLRLELQLRPPGLDQAHYEGS